MGRERWDKHAAVEAPGVVSPFAVRALRRVLLPIVRVLHRATLRGTEHLPATGGFLLVANHPSSLGIAEFASFAALYAERFGGTRPLAGFAHAGSFRWWPLSRIFPHLGVIPSTYEAAESALASGVPVALFPGGDLEGFRPFWQQRRVDFGGRVGFLRIARKAWVPVVPAAYVGVSAPLLHRSRVLPYLFVWPRFAGVKRYGLSALAVLGAGAILGAAPMRLRWRALLAFGWAASPLAMIPWLPVRIDIRIGPPISPETLFGPRRDRDDAPPDDDRAALARALGIVERAVQDLLDEA